MKRLIFLIFLISLELTAQSRYLTRTGTVSFEASVPSFEEVAATNETATAILNSDNGEFAALVLIKGFRFKNALMEEHFNENYAESDIYTKASFKGELDGFSINDIDSNISNHVLAGVLTFHGKEKNLEIINIELSKDEAGILVNGNFTAKASDFDIKIPKIVRNKIAENVNVSFTFLLKPQ